MAVRFIQQSLDKERHYYTLHADSLQQLYENMSVDDFFPDRKRVFGTLVNQGFISLLCDALQIEYRIEVGEE